MKKSKATILVALSFAMLGLLNGCDGENSNKLSQIKIGYFSNITHSQALLEKKDGSLQKAFGNKIKINWEKFDAGSSEAEAFLAGEVDIGYIGPGPAINTYIKSNGEIQIIAGGADAGAILVRRKGSNIKNIKDLSGKKIAIPEYGNTQDLILRILLDENGLKDETKGGNVEIVQAENSDIKELLDKGEIDAALVPEPWGSKLIKEIGVKLVLNYNAVWKNGRYPTTVVIARKDFIRKHMDIVEKFLKVHVNETNSINCKNDKAYEAINEELKELTGQTLDNEVLDNSFKRIKVTNNPEKKAIVDMSAWSLKEGFIKKQADFKGMFQLDILNRILKAQRVSEIN